MRESEKYHLFALTQNIFLDGPHELIDPGVMFARFVQQFADPLNGEGSGIERFHSTQQGPLHTIVTERINIGTFWQI